jgi:hypothetical protein
MKRISELIAEVVANLSAQPPAEKYVPYKETHMKFKQCPRCSGFIPNNEQPGEYPGAISRLDNVTEICSACGGEEAMLDWQHRLTDWRTPEE